MYFAYSAVYFFFGNFLNDSFKILLQKPCVFRLSYPPPMADDIKNHYNIQPATPKSTLMHRILMTSFPRPTLPFHGVNFFTSNKCMCICEIAGEREGRWEEVFQIRNGEFCPFSWADLSFSELTRRIRRTKKTGSIRRFRLKKRAWKYQIRPAPDAA